MELWGLSWERRRVSTMSLFWFGRWRGAINTRVCRRYVGGKSLITEQGYHNLMLLYSLGVWLRHKLVIFGIRLTQLRN